MNIAFFGLASFCTVFTGNAAVLPALYVIALYGFVGIEVVTRYIAEFLLFGVRGTGWELAILSPSLVTFSTTMWEAIRMRSLSRLSMPRWA